MNEETLENPGDDSPVTSAVSADDPWSPMIDKMKVSGAPVGAMNLNIEGRQPVSPLQGFGQCWQKTFKIRLTGVNKSASEVMQIWKENFPKFQPRENQFYPTLAGIKPGEVLLINAKVPAIPGTPSILPVATGVLVLYVDETTLTVMTPEGHPEAGWNTFSTYEEDDIVYAQTQSLCRPNDPLNEVFNRFLGSSNQQDKIWVHVLQSLAEFMGVTDEPVDKTKVLVDPKVQWTQAGNIWKNAAIRTVVYIAATPVRWLRR